MTLGQYLKRNNLAGNEVSVKLGEVFNRLLTSCDSEEDRKKKMKECDELATELEKIEKELVEEIWQGKHERGTLALKIKGGILSISRIIALSENISDVVGQGRRSGVYALATPTNGEAFSLFGLMGGGWPEVLPVLYGDDMTDDLLVELAYSVNPGGSAWKCAVLNPENYDRELERAKKNPLQGKVLLEFCEVEIRHFPPCNEELEQLKQTVECMKASGHLAQEVDWAKLKLECCA